MKRHFKTLEEIPWEAEGADFIWEALGMTFEEYSASDEMNKKHRYAHPGYIEQHQKDGWTPLRRCKRNNVYFVLLSKPDRTEKKREKQEAESD